MTDRLHYQWLGTYLLPRDLETKIESSGLVLGHTADFNCPH